MPLAALGWPLLLGLGGILAAPDEYAGAAALAVANTAVGVGVHKLIAWPLRRAWGRAQPAWGRAT